MQQSSISSVATATPILDLEQPLPARKPMRLRSILLGFGIGVVFMFLTTGGVEVLGTSRLLQRWLSSPLQFWERQLFLGGLIAIWVELTVAVAIHELGHFAVGKMVGFRLHALQLGPLSIVYDHGNLRIRFQPGSGLAGFAAMHVRGFSRLHRKLMMFVFAGPASNFVTAGVAVMLVRAPAVALNPYLSSGLRVLAATSCFCFATSLLPYRTASGYLTDGARLKLLLFPRPETWRWYAILGLDIQHQAGCRPREWNRRWLEVVSANADQSHDSWIGTWLAYAAANDRKDGPVAAAYLESCLRALQKIRPPFRDILINEAGIFQSWFRGDLDKANTWFNRVQKPAKLLPLQRSRARTAHQFVQGNLAAAFAEWSEGLTLIEGFQDAVQRELLRQSWLEWKQEMEQRRAATTEASVATAT